MSVSVIIVSAGKSSRMVGVDKQFIKLCGIPVIARSIIAFNEIAEVKEIIVVTSKESLDALRILTEEIEIKKTIKIVVGGLTRQESVLNGFKSIDNSTQYVAIHDGARPLITQKDIVEVIFNAKKYNASTLGVSVKDTIKNTENGFITTTLNRNSLYITQTPQVFSKEVFQRGIDYANDNNLDFTDDCQLLEAIGIKIFMTVGSYTNIKITTPEDIAIAENLLSGGNFK